MYMDNIVITGNNITFINYLIAKLHSMFALKDLGTLSYFLGIKVIDGADTLHLSQHEYNLDFLHRAKLFDYKHVSSSKST